MLLPGRPWLKGLNAEGVQNNSSSGERIRFGFTGVTLGSINENDATAAIRIWTHRLTRELNIPADPIVHIYKTFPDLVKDLGESRVDVLYMTTPQWFQVRHLVSEDGLLAVEQSAVIAEEYVLLVHKDNQIKDIQHLRQKSLRVLDNARTSLSRYWLSHFMLERGLGRYEDYFKSVTLVKNLSKAALPVFFNQSDACLVTRSGFETLAELNPQIARLLEPLAVSRPYVPVTFCFRKNYQSPLKQLLLKDMQKLVESSSGGQLLTIFQMDGMQRISVEDLAGILSLLKDGHDHTGAEAAFAKANGKGEGN